MLNTKREKYIIFLEKNNETLQGKIKTLQEEKKALQEEKKALQEEKKDLSHTDDEHNRKETDAINLIISLEEENETLQEEKDALQTEKDALQTEKDALQTKKDALIESISEHQDIINDIINDNKTLEEKYEFTDRENKALRETIENASEAIFDLASSDLPRYMPHCNLFDNWFDAFITSFKKGTHENPLMCVKCGRFAPSKNALMKHLKTQHLKTQHCCHSECKQ